MIYIYTDDFKINRSGFFRAAAFHEGREITSGRLGLGLGRHAEVFHVEMAALSIGAFKADVFLQDLPNIIPSHIAFFTTAIPSLIQSQSSSILRDQISR